MNDINSLPKRLRNVYEDTSRQFKLRRSDIKVSDERLLATLRLVSLCNIFAGLEPGDICWPGVRREVNVLVNHQEKLLEDLDCLLLAECDIILYGSCHAMINTFRSSDGGDDTDERMLLAGCLAQLVRERDAYIEELPPTWVFRVTSTNLRERERYRKAHNMNRIEELADIKYPLWSSAMQTLVQEARKGQG